MSPGTERPAALRGLAFFKPGDPTDGNPNEERFDYQLVEVEIGEMRRRVDILAGDRLEYIADIGAAGFHGERDETLGSRQQDQGLQNRRLLSEVTAAIEFAHKVRVFIDR